MTDSNNITAEQLHQLFDDFGKKKILVIGDVMLDAYWWGSVDRISPEAPVPIVLVKQQENRLGGAANVALNLKSLGAEAILCSVIGRDANGFSFRKVMDENDISTATLVLSDNRPTTVKTRVIGNKHQMLRIDQEKPDPVNNAEKKELLEIIFHQLDNGPDAIIFEDYDKGILSADLIEKVIAKARKKDIPVVVDPKRRNFMSYKGATLFKPNLKELREGLKIDFSDVFDFEEIRTATATLKNRLEVDMVMVTLSSQGIYVRDSGEHHLIPAHVRNVYDVSGAGDTVVSVAALALSSGLSSYYIASMANIAGGIVCEFVGVVPVNKELFLNECLKVFGGGKWKEA